MTTKYTQHPAIAKPTGWIWKLSTFAAIIFLIIGIFQTVKGPTKIEPLKTDFSNLSENNATDTTIDVVKDIGVEYTVSSGRRSTTTYNYFLVTTQGKKLIIETTDKSELKVGSKIAIKNSVSSKTTEKASDIRKLASQNITDESLKLTPDEIEKVLIVHHFSESDQTSSDYWGWYGFAIAAFLSTVYFFKYYFDKKKHDEYVHSTEELHKHHENLEKVQNLPATSSTEVSKDDAFTAEVKSISADLFDNKSAKSPETKVVKKHDSPSQSTKSKTGYVILAIFFGVLGLHQFYRGKTLKGLLHLIWIPMFILPLFAPEKLALIFILAFVAIPVSALVGIIQGLIELFSKK